MTKLVRILSLTSVILLLAACACAGRKPVTAEHLSNGSSIKIGMAQPIGWNCSEVAVKSFNSNDYEVVKQKALNYASSTNLKVNYIYVEMPGAMEASDSKAGVIYYQCQYVNPHNNA